jgi:hypothetical protein
VEGLDGLGGRQRPRRCGRLALPQQRGAAVQQPLDEPDQEAGRHRLRLAQPRW